MIAYLYIIDIICFDVILTSLYHQCYVFVQKASESQVVERTEASKEVERMEDGDVLGDETDHMREEKGKEEEKKKAEEEVDDNEKEKEEDKDEEEKEEEKEGDLGER